MKHLLLILPFILSTPVFAQSASCLSTFAQKNQVAQKNQEPFTSESLKSLRYKSGFAPILAVLSGATITGFGATGDINDILPPVLAVTGLPVGLTVAGIISFDQTFIQSRFEQFKQALISKYHDKNQSPYAAINTGFIHLAVTFMNNRLVSLGQGLSKNDSKRLIRFLVEEGENVNGTLGPKNLTTPMHVAVEMDNPVAVRILHELGADIYRKNNEGRTAVDLSVELGYKARRAQKELNRIMRAEATQI